MTSISKNYIIINKNDPKNVTKAGIVVFFYKGLG